MSDAKTERAFTALKVRGWLQDSAQHKRSGLAVILEWHLWLVAATCLNSELETTRQYWRQRLAGEERNEQL